MTTVPFGTHGTQSPKSTRPGLAGPFHQQHEGIPEPANKPTNESFYECSACGRRISRGDALQRAWGDKADGLLSHPMLEEAAPQIWAFEVEKFKVFHECVPLPSVDEVARQWPKLAVLKLLRYSAFWWLGMLLIAWLSGRRITVNSPFLGFFVVLGFVALVAPVMLALSFPVLDGEMRRVWTEGILSEWNDWKRSLVERNLERRRRRSSWVGVSNRP
jgi:hypothetical protein